jgi:hypothetical protein
MLHTIIPMLVLASMAGGQDVLKPISTGKEVVFADHLLPECPTIFVVIKPSSRLERDFAAKLAKLAGDNVGFHSIYLTTGTEPFAVKNGLTETPAAIVFDRRGRKVSQGTDPTEIENAVKQAAKVMRIDWAEDGSVRLAEAEKLLGRPVMPGILRTMTNAPEYLHYINDLSMKAHFADGFLKRRHKEMIATYVSSLNKCKY